MAKCSKHNETKCVICGTEDQATGSQERCEATRGGLRSCKVLPIAGSRFCTAHAYIAGEGPNAHQPKLSIAEHDVRGYIRCSCIQGTDYANCWHPPGLPCPIAPWPWLTEQDRQKRVRLHRSWMQAHACYAWFLEQGGR